MSQTWERFQPGDILLSPYKVNAMGGTELKVALQLGCDGMLNPLWMEIHIWPDGSISGLKGRIDYKTLQEARIAIDAKYGVKKS